MKKRLSYIDAIKVFALILVFVCHFTRSLEKNGVGYLCKVLPDQICNLYIGSFGVSLFFIASGASLMYVYGDKLEVKTYLKKRFWGIYPMFWLGFMLATGISFFRNQGLNPDIPKWKILFSLVGFDGNALWWGANFYQLGEWFLSVIICLYLLFPLLRKFVKRKPCVTMAAAILMLICCMIWFRSKLPIECLVFSRVPEFLFGMIFMEYIKKVRLWQFGIGILGLILTTFISLSNINVMIQTVVVGISAFLFLAFLAQKAEHWRGVKKISLLGGKYCYAFFLTHHYMTEWLTERFSGRVFGRTEVYLLFIICFIAVLVVTGLLYRMYVAVVGFLREKSE